MNSVRLTCARAASLACTVAIAGAASAQTSPYSIGVTQRFDRLDNLFNSASNEQSDTRSTTSLHLGLDQRLGRQRLFADLTGSSVRYSTADRLNNTGYSARVGLDWETVDRLSGTVSASADRGLAEFNTIGFAPSTSKNITDNRQINATARIGVVTRFTGEVSIGHRTTKFSDVAQRSRESDVNEMSVGVRYRPAAALTVGAAVRAAHGKYPFYDGPTPGSTIVEGYDRKFLDLTADWPVSGASALSARLSVGNERYDTAKVRDFSGLTGSLGWRWKPTGKLSFSSTLARDAGDQSALALLDRSAAPSLMAVNRVSNSISLGAAYELSSKINVTADASSSNGSSVTPSTGATSDDRSNSLRAGLTWSPTQAIRTGCDVARASRTSNLAQSGYSATTFGCYGELTLR